MDRTVKTRPQTLRSRRPFSHQPRLELLETRAQPGSILSGDVGLSLAADAVAFDLPEADLRMASLVRPTQRRHADATEGVQHTEVGTAAEIAVAAGNASYARDLVTANSQSTALSSAPIASRPIASVIQPVGKAAEAARTAPTTQQTDAASRTLPPPIQTPIQRTTPAGARLEVTKDFESRSWTVTGAPADIKAQLDWASFSGTVKQSTFAGATYSNLKKSVYMVGQQGNPQIGTDLIAAKISPDGATAQFVTLTMSNLTLGSDIAVDYKGTAYVVGATRLHGTIDPMVARINATFTGFDWVATVINPVVSGDVFNGVTLDLLGKNLWVGGVFNSSVSGGHTEDVVVGKYSDLANPAGPQQDALNLLVFDHPSSAADIGRSLWGDITLSGTYSPPGFREPALFRVDHNLANQQLAYYPLPGVSNEFSRLNVDWRGDTYATGRAALTNAATNVDLLLVKYDWDFTEDWFFQYDNPVDATKDFFGSDIVVDFHGFSYVTGRDTADVLVAKFAQDGASISDSIKVGSTPVGSFTGIDGGLAIARSWKGDVYVGGRASSPNFPVTSGAFATTYNGTPGDAFSMQVSNFA